MMASALWKYKPGKAKLCSRTRTSGECRVKPIQEYKPWEDVMPSETDDRPDAPRDVSRRDLFKQVGLAGAAAAFSGASAVDTAVAQTPVSVAVPRREALETLTAAEADMLEAMVARLIP